MRNDLYVNGEKISLSSCRLIDDNGGEGEIYEWNGQALKIFKDATHPHFSGNPDRQDSAQQNLSIMRDKLRWFPSGLPERVVSAQALVFDSEGEVAGYAMKLVSNAQPLYRLGQRRKTDISGEDVLAIFRDLHATVSALHRNGVVIGDFHPDNVLVQNLKAYLIDTDSFQFGEYSCDLFQEGYVDPLLCEKDAEYMKFKKRHTTDSDWYAYAVMFMQCLLGVYPYDGVYDPESRSEIAPETARRLRRITVFHRDVIYPAKGIPYQVLPDVLLGYFREVFEQDRRGILPAYLLDLRWKTCDTCRTEHAREVCPICTPYGTKNEGLTRHGRVTAQLIFTTSGRILSAEIQEGQLRYLYHEDRMTRREDGTVDGRGLFDSKKRIKHHIPRECTIGTAIMKPTDEGIVSLDSKTGRGRGFFPDTKPFVSAASYLLPAPGGLYVVSDHDIVLITIT